MALNQNLQNTANQRSEELKTSKTKTAAGETSTAKSSNESAQGSRGNQTNVDGNVGSANRDVETFESQDRSQGASIDDDRDARNH